MKSYFAGCHDLSEAKIRYRELMLDNHPDRLTQRAQEINAEYLILKNDALPDGLLPERYYADSSGGGKTVYIDRVVEKVVERPIYKDRIVEKVIERVVEKVVKEYVCRDVERRVNVPVEKIVYRTIEQEKFARLCDERPSKYFVHNGIEFRPPLNRREAEENRAWGQSWNQPW